MLRFDGNYIIIRITFNRKVTATVVITMFPTNRLSNNNKYSGGKFTEIVIFTCDTYFLIKRKTPRYMQSKLTVVSVVDD